MKIIRAQVFSAEIPLKSPYVLSFTTVEKIDIETITLISLAHVAKAPPAINMSTKILAE